MYHTEIEYVHASGMYRVSLIRIDAPGRIVVLDIAEAGTYPSASALGEAMLKSMVK